MFTGLCILSLTHTHVHTFTPTVGEDRGSLLRGSVSLSVHWAGPPWLTARHGYQVKCRNKTLTVHDNTWGFSCPTLAGCWSTHDSGLSRRKAPICGICPFPWCKHSHHDPCQAANLRTVLGVAASRRLSREPAPRHGSSWRPPFFPSPSPLLPCRPGFQSLHTEEHQPCS